MIAPALAVVAAFSAQAGNVAIPEEIRPILAAHCVDCHEGARAKAGLDLAVALAAGMADEGVVRGLRRRFARRDMPPATEAERPSDAEYRAAVAAIDAVVAPAVREVPAVRRLNRAQYAGAVRDVLGFDADAVLALLPRDEIGEGFDTTAATLALPPLLVEKYLDAAEAIADACVPPASRSCKRVYDGDSLERRGAGHAHDGVAWLATTGTLTARIEVAHAGVHRIAIDACGQFAGDEDPILQVLCDGVARKTESIRAGSGSLQSVVVEAPLGRGEHTVAARFANDFWDPKNADPARRDRNLGVARIVIEGPLGEVAPSAFALRMQPVAAGADDAARLSAIASAVGEELFRRPLSSDESAELAETARNAAGADAPFDARLRARRALRGQRPAVSFAPAGERGAGARGRFASAGVQPRRGRAAGDGACWRWRSQPRRRRNNDNPTCRGPWG